jgi:hypothetical protein
VIVVTKRNGVPVEILLVIAGLDPAIHHSSKNAFCEDGWMRGSSPRMTLA